MAGATLGKLAIKGGKKVVGEAFESLADFMPKLNKVGKELKFSPQTTDSVTRFLGDQSTENLPKQLNDVNTMLDAMVSPDGGVRNAGFRSFNEFEGNIRPLYEKTSQAESMVKRADSYKNLGQPDHYPAGITEDFTVNPELQAKSLVETSPEQIDWQWDNVEKIWADIESRIAKGTEAAALKGKEFTEDANLVSLQASLGPIDPTQVKGWVSSSMAKFKSGLAREGGSATKIVGGKAEPVIEGMSYLELHHELMKKLYAAYTMKAKALYEAGRISRMDVLNFNHLAKERGFGMGDYGVKGYERPVHSLGHQRAIAKAIQPTGEQLTKATDEISKLDNINDLTSDFLKSIDTVAEPMRRELDLSQRAYKAIPIEDQRKVILLYRKKDQLKRALKDSVLPDFEAAGIKPPKKGGGEDLLKALKKKGGTPSETTLGLQEQVNVARDEAQNFLDEIKGRTAEQIEDDIQSDIRKGIARDRPGKGVGRSPENQAEARVEDETYRQFMEDEI